MGVEETFYFVPVKGGIVRDPLTGQKIPPEGAPVPNTRFWRERVRCGDGTDAAQSQLAGGEE